MFADWEARRAAIGRGSWFVFARLRADANVEAAQRELGALARRLDVGQPDADAGRTVRIVSLREQLAGARPTAVAWTLAGATALLWLVAAVNVAGLTIARGLGRLPQLAIQAALGASRGRLVRSLLVESGVVAVLAGHWRPGCGRGSDGRDPRVRTGLCAASRRRPSRRAGARLRDGRVRADRHRDRADAGHRRLAAGSARRRRAHHRVGRGVAGASSSSSRRNAPPPSCCWPAAACSCAAGGT